MFQVPPAPFLCRGLVSLQTHLLWAPKHSTPASLSDPPPQKGQRSQRGTPLREVARSPRRRELRTWE